MQGPIGSAYPGTPAVVVFLCFLAAVYGKSVLSERRRREGVIGKRDWVANVIVAVMAALFLLVVLWAMWNHR
jgi:hypothetical protein